MNGPNGNPITGRIENGIEYVSLTDIAKDSGKDLSNYLRSLQHIEFVEELGVLRGNHGAPIMIKNVGNSAGNRDGSGQGTWAVWEVAHHYGIHINAKYAVFVCTLLEELRKGDAGIIYRDVITLNG